MFSIFIPKERGEATAVLRKVGAAWALDKSVTAMGAAVYDNGPDGGGGLLVYFDGRRGAALRPITAIDASPGAQRWCPASKRGDQPARRYWIGVREGEPIGPEDLQREDMTDGLAVQMLDGREWLCPIADYMPKRLTIDTETGEQKRDVLPEHREFVRKTNELFEHLISDEFHGHLAKTMELIIPQGMTYAADALSKNYRVNVDLLDMLGVVGEFEAVKVAAVATGLEVFARGSEQKKSALLAATSFAA